MRFVITSGCFDGKTHRKEGDVVEYSDERVISQMRAAGRLADFGSEQAERIRADVAAREKRERVAKREPWTRAHKLQVSAMIVAIILAVSGWTVAGWLALHRGDSQSGSTPVVLPPTNSAPQTAR